MLPIGGFGDQNTQLFSRNLWCNRGSAIIPSTPGLCFPKNSIFLNSLLESAASGVLKPTSAVFSMGHMRLLSIKSQSITTMLLEYWIDKSKYDPKFCPKAGFLGVSPSISSSPVSLAVFFYHKIFLLGEQIEVWFGNAQRSNRSDPAKLSVVVADVLDAGHPELTSWIVRFVSFGSQGISWSHWSTTNL